MTTYTEDDCVSTNTPSRPKKDSNVLSQKELMAMVALHKVRPKAIPKGD
jgi:hypothetical protein